MPIPDDKKQVPITLPKEIVERIDELAKQRYKTRAGYISDIVIDYVISQGKKEDKKEDSQD